MDYYQGIVADYLSADPAMFVKPQCVIRLSAKGQPKKGEHWYCDILAVNLRTQTAYLCEVTYAQSLAALVKRLGDWAANWTAVRAALVRDNHVPSGWRVRPWVFVPGARVHAASQHIARIAALHDGDEEMPMAKVTRLEDAPPWLYPAPHGLPELLFND
jgi:hypothetical protein